MYKKITNHLEKRRFILLLGLLAKISKSAGSISEKEIIVVRQFLEFYAFDEETLKIVSIGFNKLKLSSRSFHSFAKEYYSITPNSPNVYFSILELLVKLISRENKVLDEAEKENLLIFKNVFYISNIKYKMILDIYFKKSNHYTSIYSAENDDINLCYSILGCSNNSTIKVIKKQYRKLINDSHPDKIIAKGLPEEFIAIATKRFLEIRKAYEIIGSQRKFL